MSVYQKLLDVQNELHAPKSQRNNFGNYNYRSCEDIVEAVKPLCKQHGLLLFISDELKLIGERYYIEAKATVIDVETEKEIFVTALARESETKRGMDDSQITGSTSSYARKYALNGLFAIDDTKDADTDEQAKQAQNNTKTNNKTLSDAQVKRLYAIASSKNISKDDVLKSVKKDYKHSDPKELTKKQYDELCGRLEKLPSKDEDHPFV